ncbi:MULTISPECIES: antibiotic biosynthesis monooxygenase [Jeongeupia]|uniref:Antibiotic biosynthesis monooxygenase n=2 Tax=Jeongeupia TaxID=885864 RepID=A0ABS2BG71_9NEIS|nr:MULTISPECIES: antibiotic biosynthesis monooxygenase [Jeongeupia]MBM3114614.1 antibiotic biosynthesis monooxygenase [Jeongeupia naejangsanensis]GHD63653.1 hypothetical protein GCM10007350_21540 [Jeongeupia chitinilytica]
MSNQAENAVYRVDRFTVPEAALAVFLARVEQTNRLLALQPGHRLQRVLTRAGNPHQVVTVIEWADAAALTAAKRVVEQHYAETGFDAAAFMQQLGIHADMGVFHDVPAVAAHAV